MDAPSADPGAASFDELLERVRARLLPVLWSRWGVEVGSDVCAEVEEYAWANRERLLRMENPLGYLYRVSQSRSRRYARWTRRTTFPSRFPDVVHEDPRLHDVLQLLAAIDGDQRTCVLLVHGFGWSYDEVAELLGVPRTTVNNHVHRGLARLRSSIGPAGDRIPFSTSPHEPEATS